MSQAHRQVAIVGIGQTVFARRSGRSAWELALEAALGALADAGIDPREVDGLVRYALPTEYVSIPMMQRSLGATEPAGSWVLAGAWAELVSTSRATSMEGASQRL